MGVLTRDEVHRVIGYRVVLWKKGVYTVEVQLKYAWGLRCTWVSLGGYWLHNEGWCFNADARAKKTEDAALLRVAAFKEWIEAPAKEVVWMSPATK